MKKQNFFSFSRSSKLFIIAFLAMGIQLHAQVSVWHFDDNADATPTTYNATLVGSPTYTAGKVNNALTLSGTGQYASTPFVFNPTTSPFTINVWVKYTGALDNTLTISPAAIQQTNGTGNAGRGLLWISAYSATATQSLKFSSSIGVSATYGTTTVVANTWYMVSVTYSGGRVRIYVNGVEDANAAKTAESCNGGLLFGCNKGIASFWTGLIDEVEVYNTAKSAADLLAKYNGITTKLKNTNTKVGRIYTSAKSIVVEDFNSEVSVFNLSGVNIQSSKTAGTFRSKVLNAGMYFVRVDGVNTKVLVK